MSTPFEQDLPLNDGTLPGKPVAHVNSTQPVVNGVACTVDVIIVDTSGANSPWTAAQRQAAFTDAHNLAP